MSTNNLVMLAIDKLDEVLFLTLNYDTLLEIPLAKNFGIDFSEETHYINQNGWSLVKLHGSTNWYRSFHQTQTQVMTNISKCQKQYPLPLPLQNNFILINMSGYGNKYIGNSPVYPAITVPVDGKYDINCPKAHEEKLKMIFNQLS